MDRGAWRARVHRVPKSQTSSKLKAGQNNYISISVEFSDVGEITIDIRFYTQISAEVLDRSSSTVLPMTKKFILSESCRHKKQGTRQMQITLAKGATWGRSDTAEILRTLKSI